MEVLGELDRAMWTKMDTPLESQDDKLVRIPCRGQLEFDLTKVDEKMTKRVSEETFDGI